MDTADTLSFQNRAAELRARSDGLLKRARELRLRSEQIIVRRERLAAALACRQPEKVRAGPRGARA